MKKAAILLAAALVFGCGDDDDSNNANNANNANNSDGWAAGGYTVTVLDVTDNCFDGAMDVIVLPDGTPRALPAAVTLPAPGDLPASIDIEFNEPFQDVTGVAIEAAGSGFTTSGTGFSQTGVDITSDGGDCVADMTGTFTLTPGADGLTGSGSLSITSATGADCPAFQAGPPCTVVSNLSAVPAN